MKPCAQTLLSAAATLEKKIRFFGPRSETPTELHLRVFEVPGRGSVAVLSESEDNRGLPLGAVEAGIPAWDAHAVPSNLTGLAAVAQEHCASFWDGFIVLLETPTSGSRSGETHYVVRYQVGDRDWPDTLSGAEVEALIAPPLL